MKRKLNSFLLYFLLGLLFSPSLKSQNPRILTQNSSIIIYGTSNLHKWDMRVTHFTADLTVSGSEKLNSLIIKVPVQSIKSESSIMDKKAYDALKYEKNPTIVFQLTEAAQVKQNIGNVEVLFTGNLTIAGVTRKVNLKASGKLNSDKSSSLTGSIGLKMTDFGIKPPTALLGTLKTGDDIVVKFVVAVSNLSFN